MRNNDILKFLIFMLILLGITWAVPYTQVLSKSGLADPQTASTLGFFGGDLYYGAFIGVILAFFVNLLFKKDDKYKTNKGIFKLENSILKQGSHLQSIWASIIVFGAMFLIANGFGAGSGTGLRVLPQQFSRADSLIFSTLLTPTPENMLLTTVISIFVFIFSFYAVKLKISDSDFDIYSALIWTIGSSLLAVLWHMSVYGGSDVNLLVVAVFWGLIGIMQYFTWFAIPLIFHMMNNFFIDFSRLFTSDTVFAVTIIVLLLLSAGYYFAYRNKGLSPLKGSA